MLLVIERTSQAEVARKGVAVELTSHGFAGRHTFVAVSFVLCLVLFNFLMF